MSDKNLGQSGLWNSIRILGIAAVSTAFGFACLASDHPFPPPVAVADAAPANAPTENQSLTTLVDGLEIGNEKWGPTFQAIQPRNPLLKRNSRTIYKGHFGDSLKLDLAGKKIYWLSIDRDAARQKRGTIMSANLDGTGVKTVLSRLKESCTDLSVDSIGKKIYWQEPVAEGKGRMIRRADLDGRHLETWIPRVNSESLPVLRVPETDKLLYFKTRRDLVELQLDASGETRIKELPNDYAPRCAYIEPVEKKLYFATGGKISRLNVDGSELEDLFVDRGILNVADVTTIAVDSRLRKVYWGGHHGLRRANFDGSQIEQLLLEPIRVGDIDVGNSEVFYTIGDLRPNSAGIARQKLPLPSESREMVAPPEILSLEPSSQAVGKQVVLKGRHFENTKEVVFLDGDSGRTVTTKFHLDSDNQLTVTVPTLAKDCLRAAIVVRTPSGVGVTVPRQLAIARGDPELIKRKFRRVIGPGDKGDIQIRLDRLTPLEQPDAFFFVHGNRTAVSGFTRSVVFTMSGAKVSPDAQGSDTIFLRNGTYLVGGGHFPDCTVYHEPFAVLGRALPKSDYAEVRMIAVPAIRYSVVPELLEIEKP